MDQKKEKELDFSKSVDGLGSDLYGGRDSCGQIVAEVPAF